MQKNTASQKFVVFAFNRTTNVPITGDAANITANLQKDFGSTTGTNDTNPTELEDGYYAFDATQAETNADSLVIYPVSSTSDIQVIGVPAQMFTVSTGSPDEVAQTADHTAGIADIPTVSEFNARTLVAASYFDASSDGVIVTTNNDKTGYSLTQSFPTNFSAQIITAGGAVDSLIQGYLNTLITESTAGRISNNFDFFYDNSDAQTAQVVDDVGGGGGGGTDWTASERNEIRGRLGVTGTTASGGNTPTLSLEATVAALNDISAADVNAQCDIALADYDGPTNAEMIARTLVSASYYDFTTDQVILLTATQASIDAIEADTNELQSDDVPGLIAALNDVSTADVNAQCDISLADYDGPTNAEMIARTLLAGSYYDFATDQVILLTATQASIDAIETDTGTDIPARFDGVEGSGFLTATDSLEEIRNRTGSVPTAVQNRQEMDSNSTQLSAIVLDTGTTLPAQINSFTIPKNASYSNFPFLMVLASDGRTPATGLTVTGQRSIDGAAFQSVGGSIAEVSNGIYQFDALAADTNGDLIVWRFSSATADDTFERLQTI